MANIVSAGIIHAPDLLSYDCQGQTAQAIAEFDEVTADIADGCIHLIGFSIGAMVAMKIASVRSQRLGRLTLVSAAAPLSLGSFLPDMAGRSIFTLALKLPGALLPLSIAQGLFSRFFPNTLFAILFAISTFEEKSQLEDDHFRGVLSEGLKNSFQRRPRAYTQYLQAYVSDWASLLKRIECSTEIWHGSNDTWAPVAMAYALANEIPNASKPEIVINGEHYSTLSGLPVRSLFV